MLVYKIIFLTQNSLLNRVYFVYEKYIHIYIFCYCDRSTIENNQKVNMSDVDRNDIFRRSSMTKKKIPLQHICSFNFSVKNKC